jgi:hypothetical protein
MSEEKDRVEYWEAIHKLVELIEKGCTDIEEIKSDLGEE